MSYTCYGEKVRPAPHSHDRVEDAKRCYGLLPAYVTPPAAPVHAPAAITAPARSYFGHRTRPEGPLSQAQFNYIKDLGGDQALAYTMTYTEASIYITKLKGSRVTTPKAEEPNPKLDMVTGLLALVPDGYYATRLEEGSAITFMRVNLAKSKHFNGARKIQTLHGTGWGMRARLEEAAVYWPSGRWSIYKPFILDELLLLCADWQHAALLYAEHIGRCCRCNAELTDPRSRYYGIGPECETHWPQVLDLVDEKKGPYRGEG